MANQFEQALAKQLFTTESPCCQEDSQHFDLNRLPVARQGLKPIGQSRGEFGCSFVVVRHRTQGER